MMQSAVLIQLNLNIDPPPGQDLKGMLGLQQNDTQTQQQQWEGWKSYKQTA